MLYYVTYFFCKLFYKKALDEKYFYKNISGIIYYC